MPKMPRVSVEIDVDPEASPQALRPEPDTPFRVLLLGDFSGRGQRGEPARRPSKPILIDRDNFDEVLARIRRSWPWDP